MGPSQVTTAKGGQRLNNSMMSGRAAAFGSLNVYEDAKRKYLAEAAVTPDIKKFVIKPKL